MTSIVVNSSLCDSLHLIHPSHASIALTQYLSSMTGKVNSIPSMLAIVASDEQSRADRHKFSAPSKSSMFLTPISDADNSRGITNGLEYTYSSPSACTSTLGMGFNQACPLFRSQNVSTVRVLCDENGCLPPEIRQFLKYPLFRGELKTLGDLTNDLEYTYSSPSAYTST
ncbi:hypothetical protein ONZ45_g15466 [Pleurotus djamor]|nr:hypothetical protein ONZ45_g15466 [Pleurotus djamor]